MKQVVPIALKYTLCTLALFVTLLPLAKMLHKQTAKSDPQDWYEETFLFI